MRSSRRCTYRRSPAAAALLALLVGSAAVPDAFAAGGIREIVREPAPLVLKDGRIAHVRVYAVPFKEGASDLESGVRAELTGLIETIATDCFLTAQAIGHVEPSAAKSGESLTAHRLARTRADRVQAAMVARGFSTNSIASVWDWQFLVGEPRVTLWVFRLNEGEDCKGEAMAKPDGKQVVTAGIEKDLPSRGQPTKPQAAPEAVAKELPPAPAPVAVKPPVESPTQAVATPVASPQAPAVAEPPATTAAPTNAAKPAPPPAREETTVVAPEPPQPAATAVADAGAPAAPQSATRNVAARADGDGMDVVFDVNSSFFSKDVRNALKQFLATLPRDKPVTLDVVAAVGGADVRESANGDPLRYNRWMAERRSGRIVDYLKDNAGGRRLEFNSEFQENDGSRSVMLRIRPLR